MSKSRAEYLLHPQPRPLSRRGWRSTIIALVVLVAAILAVSIAYENEGDLNTTGGLEVPADPGISVTIQPLSLEAATNTMTARLVFNALGTDYVDIDSDTLLQNTRITVATTEGNQEFYYPQGSHLGAAQVILGADGSVSSYPFDSYSSDLYVRAEKVQRETGGAWTVVGPIPVGTYGAGGLSGWDVSLDMPTTMDDGAQVSMEVVRAFSTKLFAIVLLITMTALAAVALFIALLVSSGRRRMEVALLGWLGSLLFALPLLRNSLPNAPPIGASIDILLFLWVLLAAMAAMILSAVTWTRAKKAELNALRDDN
jgi:hypothetical protein